MRAAASITSLSSGVYTIGGEGEGNENEKDGISTGLEPQAHQGINAGWMGAMEDSGDKSREVPVVADWNPLKSALSLSSEDVQKFTFLGFVICHGGERIYIYKDIPNQRRIYVDKWGNFHCGSCVSRSE